jgi:hypothetical protein
MFRITVLGERSCGYRRRQCVLVNARRVPSAHLENLHYVTRNSEHAEPQNYNEKVFEHLLTLWLGLCHISGSIPCSLWCHGGLATLNLSLMTDCTKDGRVGASSPVYGEFIDID